MLEPQSALAAVYRTGRFGIQEDDPAIVIRERSNRGLVQVAGWPESFGRVCSLLGDRLGLTVPGDCCTAASTKGHTVFRVGPERLWIAGATDSLAQPADRAALREIAVVTELGHSRTVIRVTGAAAATLLNRGLPVDLDETMFPEHGFAQSAIHHIPVLVHRLVSPTLPAFDVYVPREYAVTFWEWLVEAAGSFGGYVEERS